jgi:peptide deformylase
MAVFPIVEVPDARLRSLAEPVEAVDEGVRQLAADMLESMYAAKGIGLAAPQLGVLRRVVVIDLQERGEEDENAPPIRRPQAFVNPAITWQSDELSTYNEGCLSIPDQYAEVTRPARCRVSWLDLDGQAHEEEMDGMMATCMQHEIDHLNGILFIDHLTRLKRDMLLKKLAKLRKSAA